MAGQTLNVYVSGDTLIKLDQLVINARMAGNDSNRSQAVSSLITQAYANLKRIEPIRNAKGRTVGHRAMYGDHIVGDFDLMDKDGAQLALDRFAYEELSR